MEIYNGESNIIEIYLNIYLKWKYMSKIRRFSRGSILHEKTSKISVIPTLDGFYTYFNHLFDNNKWKKWCKNTMK